MLTRSFVSLVLSLSALVPLSPAAAQTTYRVYYLGGQSNMDGFGQVTELPAELRDGVPGVLIFHGNQAPDDAESGGLGLWTGLRPGHGWGFSSDGVTNSYGPRFGVELTFARGLQELNPDTRIALIKYSRGGTSIDLEAGSPAGTWHPDYDGATGVNQYDHFLATIRNALAVQDIDGDGSPDELIPAGIVWMQGESDAGTEEVAGRYEANLTQLMNLIRAALRVDDLPIVIGRISDSGQDEEDGRVWDHGEIVREAQARFAERDCCAILVTSTDGYEYSDPWHYDSAGFLDLGRRFAEAMFELEREGSIP